MAMAGVTISMAMAGAGVTTPAIARGNTHTHVLLVIPRPVSLRSARRDLLLGTFSERSKRTWDKITYGGTTFAVVSMAYRMLYAFTI